MAEKIPVSVHLVDVNQFEGTSFDEIVNEIIAIANQDGNKFKPADLNGTSFEDFSIRIYYSYAKYPPKWRGFLEPLLDKTTPLATCENRSHSYVCFIGFEQDVYAVTGGFGSLAVTRFMVPNFGLEIIVRLFDANSKVVKSIHDRGLTGNVLGQARFFRGDQKFSDENRFGKIFKQIQAELSTKILTKRFGFSEGDLRRTVSGCLAKESFQTNKSVDFKALLSLVRKFNEILKLKAKFSLNRVVHLSKRNPQYNKLREELEAWVIDSIYNDCKRGDDPDVDFCNKDFETFFAANSFAINLGKESIPIEKHSSFGSVVRLIKKKGYCEDGSAREFDLSVLCRVLESYDEDGNVITRGTIWNHINGEFVFNGHVYFRVDEEWHQLQRTFIKSLNDECSQIFKDAWDDEVLPEQFDLTKRESTFNQKFIGKPGFLVFDTITPDNIESCDILKNDANEIHLIHVKKGFDNSIRELASQINVAAKYIREDLRTGYKYLEKVEAQTKKGIKSKNPDLQRLAKQAFPKDGIASLFKGRRTQNIIFCLAFVDKSVTERSLKDEIQKFNSNIAKFSLLELRRELLGIGFGFKIIQLQRT